MKYLFISLLILVVFIISVTLGAQNDQLIVFNYLIAKDEYRTSSLLAILFASGFIIGWLIGGVFWIKVRISLARAERKIRYLENKTLLTKNINIK